MIKIIFFKKLININEKHDNYKKLSRINKQET